MGKRIFDIVLSLFGLVLLWPVFLLIAALIKLDSKGPVFYRQIRIGRNGKPFNMLKFRTMMETSHWSGPSLSPMNDPRVTNFGALLRRTKFNEFPQIINVLIGDMSMVGPRPEVPEFVEVYSEEQRKVLSVRPGIVGPCQIYMRNEEELFEKGVNPKHFYIEQILPQKLKIDLEYVQKVSLHRDLFYVFYGVWTTITGAITKRHFLENAEQIILLMCDCFLCAFSYAMAYFLRMEGNLPYVEQIILLDTLPYVVMARILTLAALGSYNSLIQYVTLDEIIRIGKGVVISTVIIIITTFLFGHRTHPRSVFAVDSFIIMMSLGGYRAIFRAARHRLEKKTSRAYAPKKVLIYGAGATGDLALRYLKMLGNTSVIAFVDDDPRKIRKSFHGIKIAGNRYDIESLVRLHQVDEMLIAIRNMKAEDLAQIRLLCENAEIRCDVFALAH